MPLTVYCIYIYLHTVSLLITYFTDNVIISIYVPMCFNEYLYNIFVTDKLSTYSQIIEFIQFD